MIALAVAGCSFDTAGPGSTPTPGQGETSGPMQPSTSSSGDPVEDSSGEDDTAPATTAEGPQTTTGSGTPTSSNSSTTAEPDASSSGEPEVDCTIPITVTVAAADAELVAPMELRERDGVVYAASDIFNGGSAAFAFDVACPSSYRLFGRVLDMDPGTHNCCDPDSFDVDGPFDGDQGFGGISWYYGCVTESAGWSWAQVSAGEFNATCSELSPTTSMLSAGTHTFTVHNRESSWQGAHAGIAELVLTNDPDYEPGG